MATARDSTIHPARQSATAAVALITGPELPAGMADVARWRRLTPSAVWTSVGATKVDRTTIVEDLGTMVSRRGLRTRQVILLGAGETGRSALEAVLQGALDCAGMLAVNIPCDALSFRIAPVAAAIRLVVHQDNLQLPEGGLVRQLQRADVDVRVIGLGAAVETGAVARAAEAFVLELVAIAGRKNGNGV
jgi:hypothetical protein